MNPLIWFFFLKIKMDQAHISGTAVIITGGLLHDSHAKTAHGLLRAGKRFKILGIIDEKHAGSDASDFVEGTSKGIPVVQSIDVFIHSFGKPEYAIIGMATKGGLLPRELYASIQNVLKNGIHLVNGLHEPLNDLDELKPLLVGGAKIFDIRKPKAFKDLHFWQGKVAQITALKIAVLGMDCATGKRTTSRFLEEQLNAKGHPAEMIYTGQTGWMQGADYGLLFDATPNDFIPGELEYALYSCWEEKRVDILIIEGQSSLRNPSGPCGSEFIISGDLDGVILQHVPMRKKFSGFEKYPAHIPDILNEVMLIEHLGTRVLGITLNGEGAATEQLSKYRDSLAQKTSIPIIIPMIEPMDPIISNVLNQKL